MCIAEKQHSGLSCVPPKPACCVQTSPAVHKFNFLIGFRAHPLGIYYNYDWARNCYIKFLFHADILCDREGTWTRAYDPLHDPHYERFLTPHPPFPPPTTTLTLEEEDLSVATKPKKSSTDPFFGPLRVINMEHVEWKRGVIETWDRKGFDVDRKETMFEWKTVDGMCLELGVHDFIAGSLHLESCRISLIRTWLSSSPLDVGVLTWDWTRLRAAGIAGLWSIFFENFHGLWRWIVGACLQRSALGKKRGVSMGRYMSIWGKKKELEKAIHITCPHSVATSATVMRIGSSQVQLDFAATISAAKVWGRIWVGTWRKNEKNGNIHVSCIFILWTMRLPS